jgi:hypothetical protein
LTQRGRGEEEAKKLNAKVQRSKEEKKEGRRGREEEREGHRRGIPSSLCLFVSSLPLCVESFSLLCVLF